MCLLLVTAGHDECVLEEGATGGACTEGQPLAGSGFPRGGDLELPDYNVY